MSTKVAVKWIILFLSLGPIYAACSGSDISSDSSSLSISDSGRIGSGDNSISIESVDPAEGTTLTQGSAVDFSLLVATNIASLGPGILVAFLLPIPYSENTRIIHIESNQFVAADGEFTLARTVTIDRHPDDPEVQLDSVELMAAFFPEEALSTNLTDSSAPYPVIP